MNTSLVEVGPASASKTVLEYLPDLAIADTLSDLSGQFPQSSTITRARSRDSLGYQPEGTCPGLNELDQ